MTVREQIYLLQLENYDLDRFNLWRRNNPDRKLYEKKGHIVWTDKAIILYGLAVVFGIETAMRVFSPIDWILKKTLVLLAALKLALFHKDLVTIGVTGSWGKTTTKEILAAILAEKFQVYKTLGNNNTLLGVAGNILKMPINTAVFVCEMGAYKKGDIKRICDLVKPKVGVVTSIGPMHLERFGSLPAIKETKYELLQAIPAGGLMVPPENDAIVEITKYFLLDPEKVKEILRNLPAVTHRLEVTEKNGLKIIDDSYNSNPAGFARALDFLAKTAGEPKILVTPGMIELGKLQAAENRKASSSAVKVCDWVIIVGTTNKNALKTGLGEFKNYRFANDLDEVQKILSEIAVPGSVVLFENDLPDNYF